MVRVLFPAGANILSLQITAFRLKLDSYIYRPGGMRGKVGLIVKLTTHIHHLSEQINPHRLVSGTLGETSAALLIVVTNLFCSFIFSLRIL
jgi:hypothetical protein